MEKNVQKVNLDEIRLAREALNKELGITTPEPEYKPKKQEATETFVSADEKVEDVSNQTIEASNDLNDVSTNSASENFDNSENLSDLLNENFEEDDEELDEIDFSVYDNFAPFEVNKEIKSNKPVVKKVAVKEPVVNNTTNDIATNSINTDINTINSSITDNKTDNTETANKSEDNFINQIESLFGGDDDFDNFSFMQEVGLGEEEKEPEILKPKTLDEAISNISSLDDLLNMDLDSIQIDEDELQNQPTIIEEQEIVEDDNDSEVTSEEPVAEEVITEETLDEKLFGAEFKEEDILTNALKDLEEEKIKEDILNNLNAFSDPKPIQTVTKVVKKSNTASENKTASEKITASGSNFVSSTSGLADNQKETTFDFSADSANFNVDRVVNTPAEVSPVETQNVPAEAHIISIEKDIKEPEIDYLKKIDDYDFIEIIKSNEFMDSDELTCIYGVDEDKNVVCNNFKDFYNTVIFSENDESVFKLFSSIMMSLTLKNSNYLIKFAICDAKNGSKFDVYNDLSYMFFSRVAKANSEIIDSLTELTYEIDKRYENLAKASVKNIEEFNDVMKNANIVPMSYVLLFFNNYTRAIHFDDNNEIDAKLHYILKYGRLVGIYVNLVSSDEKLEDKINFNLQTRISFKANSKEISNTRIGYEGAERLGSSDEFVCKTLFSDKVLHLKAPEISQREVELLVKNIEN